MNQISPSLIKVAEHPNEGANGYLRKKLGDSLNTLASETGDQIKFEHAIMGVERQLYPIDSKLNYHATSYFELNKKEREEMQTKLIESREQVSKTTQIMIPEDVRK